jgi:enoyl-CoA hydratase
MPSWTLSLHGRVALLTFTRPPRNWMNLESMTELVAELGALADRTDDVSVVVLTGGVDGYFVAHADLDDLALFARGERPPGDPGAWVEALRLLEDMPQPTVAAIDGQAYGGGCEIALACTMRLASSRAHLGLPEVSVGIIPGAGGTQRMPRLIGSGKAAELILQTKIVRAEEAVAIGLVNAALPEDGFVEAAVDWCQRMASHPPAAVFAGKRAIVDGLRGTFDDGLRLEGRLFAGLNSSDDARTRNAAVQRPD